MTEPPSYSVHCWACGSEIRIDNPKVDINPLAHEAEEAGLPSWTYWSNEELASVFQEPLGMVLLLLHP